MKPFYRSKPCTPEKVVQNSVVAQLKFHGWFVQRNQQQGIGMTNGRPDLEAYKNGMVLFVECKAPQRKCKNGKMIGGKLSDEQKAYFDKLKDHGMTIWIVDDPEKFLEDLERLQEELWPGKNIRRLC